MNTPLTAKQLTFRYFAIVAIAIIAIHASVFEMTTDDLEHFYAQNRLDKIQGYLANKIEGQTLEELKDFELSTDGLTDFDNKVMVYFNFDSLPNYFPEVSDLPYGEGVEAENDELKAAFFAMRVQLKQENLSRDALIVIDNRLYELSEEQATSSQTKAVLLSVVLTIISLLAVTKISARLTNPISTFARTLSEKQPEDLTEVEHPEGMQTKELHELVETFNSYQSRISQMLEKERAFNRYASHELRSPLMVMRGAITLLGESNDPEFIERQRRRLSKACSEMSEFTETLLSLTKPVESIEECDIRVSEMLIREIVESHDHMIEDKPISLQVEISGNPNVRMPAAAFHMMLGNLVKNAFAYTQEGEVIIECTPSQLRVIDTGKGCDNTDPRVEGYGLGLLLVKDICRQFGFAFELIPNNTQGTIAKVGFSSH